MITKRALVSVALLVALAAVLSLVVVDRVPIAVPVSMSKRRFPQTEVELNGKTFSCDLKITGKYPMHLDSASLEDIPKCYRSKTIWKTANGSEKTGDLVLLPSVKLGRLRLGTVLAVKDPCLSPDSSGSITWPLSKINLLIDLPRRTFWGVYSDRQLPFLGFDLNKMEKVKCKIDDAGIYFTITTFHGELSAALFSSCNENVIRKSLWKEEADYLDCSVVMGTRCFGTARFLPLEFTGELKADAILGVEFLHRHVVYVDAKNEYLYIGDRFASSSSNHFISTIPIQFTDDARPIVDISIGQQGLKALLDTGCSLELSFSGSCVSCDDLRWLYKSERFNYLGEFIDTNCYLLPSYRFGGVDFASGVLTVGDDLRHDTNVAIELGDGTAGYQGLVGLPLIFRSRLYCDFPRAQISLVNHPKYLRKVGADLAEFESIPFSIEQGWLILEVEASWGPMRLLLDTGASVSVVFQPPTTSECLEKDELGNDCWLSPVLQIGNIDYGQQQFYALEVSDKLRQFDGILGMTFLREHPFYIDYPNRLIYFKRPTTSP